MNIEKDLFVDLQALDEMIKDQPIKLFRYSEALAEEKEKLGDLELQLSIKTAKVEKAIRAGEYAPAKDVKLTEGTVKAFIADDIDLIELHKQIIKQKSYVAKLAGVVDAFQHRKHSINNGITLWTQNYYADNFKVPKKDDVMNSQRDGMRRRREVNNESG